MLFLDNDNKIIKDVLEGRLGEKCACYHYLETR